MVDFKEIQEKVKAQQDCPKHHFEPLADGYKIGVKLTCTECGSDMGLREIGLYIRGYEAGGGSGADILQGWKSKSKS
jgi:hypothetical protein